MQANSAARSTHIGRIELPQPGLREMCALSHLTSINQRALGLFWRISPTIEQNDSVR